MTDFLEEPILRQNIAYFFGDTTHLDHCLGRLRKYLSPDTARSDFVHLVLENLPSEEKGNLVSSKKTV